MDVIKIKLKQSRLSSNSIKLIHRDDTLLPNMDISTSCDNPKLLYSKPYIHANERSVEDLERKTSEGIVTDDLEDSISIIEQFIDDRGKIWNRDDKAFLGSDVNVAESSCLDSAAPIIDTIEASDESIDAKTIIEEFIDEKGKVWDRNDKLFSKTLGASHRLKMLQDVEVFSGLHSEVSYIRKTNRQDNENMPTMKPSNLNSEEISTSLTRGATFIPSDISVAVPVISTRMDDVNKVVQPTKSVKKHFCYFCLKLVSKLARHLLTVHKGEKKVQEILQYPIGHISRMKLLSLLRNKGDFLYNFKNYEKENLIVVRRSKMEKKASHYRPCGRCHGMYSVKSLGQHYSLCNPQKVKGSREGLRASKKLYCMAHPTANTILRSEILPLLRTDDITNKILGDETIIMYGNRLTQKYSSSVSYQMIRAKLRCVGRCYYMFDKNVHIKSFDEIFKPEHYGKLVEIIKLMRSLDIASHLKKICLYLISESNRQYDEVRKKELNDFLQLMYDRLRIDISKISNKTVNEKVKRKKHVALKTYRKVQDLSNDSNVQEKKDCLHNSKLISRTQPMDDFYTSTKLDGNEITPTMKSSTLNNDEISTSSTRGETLIPSDISVAISKKIHYENNVVQPNKSVKKHFCYFCLKLVSKLARHLLTVHKGEKKVQEILQYPKGHTSRMKVLSLLRNKGDFIYNVKNNEAKNLIVVRRSKMEKNASHYRPCGRCHGMYSVKSLRHHYSLCDPEKVKGTRVALIASKKLYCMAHPAANTILRSEIIPLLRTDDITNKILGDETIIMYGNRLTQKYSSSVYNPIIRSKLRCVGRCYYLFDKKFHIKSFDEIFKLEQYGNLVEIIKLMKGLHILSHLKKICLYLISETTNKQENEVRRRELKDFLILLQDRLPTDTSKTVKNSVNEGMRREHMSKKKVNSKMEHRIREISAEDSGRDSDVQKYSSSQKLKSFNSRTRTIDDIQTRPTSTDSTKPPIERRPWSADEKLVVEKEMKFYMENFELPSLHYCEEIIQRCDALKKRSATQLKAFVANYVSKKKKDILKPQAEECSRIEPSNTFDKPHIERRPWTADEKLVVEKKMKFYMENFELPSLNYCEEVIGLCPALKKRSATQLKAFVANYVSKKKKGIFKPSSKECSKIGKKISWTDSEKQIVFQTFDEFIKEKRLPSLKFCQKIVDENAVLHSRTPEMLKAFINNQIRKKH